MKINILYNFVWGKIHSMSWPYVHDIYILPRVLTRDQMNAIVSWRVRQTRKTNTDFSVLIGYRRALSIFSMNAIFQRSG